MGKNMMQGTSADIKNKEMENRSAGYEALGQIEEALEGEEYRTAFRLFRRDITGILCREGILEVCSPYYHRNGKIKEDKVAGELVGVYEYYYSGNDGFRSFRPRGKSFRCGKRTASFLDSVKKFLSLLLENMGQDPWEIFNNYMGSEYFDLENYLDKAGVYGFPHNRRSREVTKAALEPYVKKYYGVLDAEPFVDLYQTMDRVYTTYGFPFACTHAGWFFEGYDSLYRKVFDEGAWTLRNLWENGLSDWLEKQMEPYPEIYPTYEELVTALQKPEYEALLCRLFPFRLTEDTLRAGCGIESDEWEEFTLKLAKTLYFMECGNGRKNVPEKTVMDAAVLMEELLKTVRHYMDSENMY